MNLRKLNVDANLTEVLAWGKAVLDSAGIYPAEREARWLLEYVLGNNKLIIEPNSRLIEKQRKRYEDLISKRTEKYPLQYLIGEVEFAGAVIEVTPDVLIPRPETELLVDYVLEFIKGKEGDIKCADLGTGSGCIAIAILKKLQIINCKLQISNWHACDKSEKALELARKNAKKNGVDEQISFYLGSWFGAFPKELKFDLIVSNPPYVRAEEKLEPELAHEPSTALFSGKDGLDDYREIISSLKNRLLPGGIFIGEFSPEQADELIKISKENGFAITKFLQDLTGRERFIIIKTL